MDMLQGKKLITKDCQSYKASHYLKKVKIIAYYFSASWVDDVDVLKKLQVIYAENTKREIGMEVIYVSSDTEEKLFNKSFREHHGPWPAIAAKNTALAEELRYRYNITCLPQLIVVRKDDGFIITRRGREELEKYGINVLVSWSDYEPSMTLISEDDKFIELALPEQQDAAQGPAENIEVVHSATQPEEEEEDEDEDEDEDDQNPSKILSFASQRSQK